MKVLTLVLLGVGALMAQTVPIAGTLSFPYNQTAAGCKIVVTGPNAPTTMHDQNGNEFTAGKLTVSIGASGAYSFRLQPNSLLTPANTTYTAFYQCFNGELSHTETWAVPTSGSTLKINDVKLTGAPPSPSYTLPWRQFDVSGVPDGSCLTAVGGKPVWVANCSGGGTLSLSSLTNPQLLALTNPQLLSLGN